MIFSPDASPGDGDEMAGSVPQWHKDILDEREQQITDGKAKFIDWEDAKKQIRAAVR